MGRLARRIKEGQYGKVFKSGKEDNCQSERARTSKKEYQKDRDKKGGTRTYLKAREFLAPRKTLKEEKGERMESRQE